MAWEDLIRLLRRSRQSETVTNPPYAPPVYMRRGQKVFDIANVTDVVYTKIRAAVLETLSVSDEVNFFLSKLQQSVGDVISVSDLVDYLIHEYIRQNVTDSLSVSDAVNFVLGGITRVTAAASDSLTVSDLLRALRKDFAPRDTLSLSESVTYQLRSPQPPPSGYIIPDGYLVYNQMWQPISANLSVWWDNNTSTSYPLFYSPPMISNPRVAFLYFNTPVTLPRDIEIYISDYTVNKTLHIRVYYFGGNVSAATLVPNRSGWFTVTLETLMGDYFDEMEISPDTSIGGFIQIAEFHVLNSSSSGGSSSSEGGGV